MVGMEAVLAPGPPVVRMSSISPHTSHIGLTMCWINPACGSPLVSDCATNAVPTVMYNVMCLSILL